MLARLIGGCVMDWTLAMEEERAALKRVVALLFALADLAERAHRRCRLVRRFVLWILRPAETVAREFVLDDDDASDFIQPVSAGDTPADALLLAERFRDLARELDRQSMFAFAVPLPAGQAGPARSGVRRTRNAHDFLNALRQALANIAPRAAYATGPPDMS